MEILFAFICGAALASATAFFIAKAALKTKFERICELKEELRGSREEQEKVHREAMAALQAKFDETISRVQAQIRTETENILKDRQKEFSETSTSSLGQILEPLKNNIKDLREAMNIGRQEQAGFKEAMKGHIDSLITQSKAARTSADNLAEALRRGSKVQGDWGETVLEELLSSQGLTEGVHFETQATMTDAGGRALTNDSGSRMRPDIILHLDEHRDVIIDSKVSVSAYMDYVNAENDNDRNQYLKAHLASIHRHIDELAKKDYSGYVKYPKVSVGYVIMFVPNLGAFWTALGAEPDLWRRAADRNVYIADEQSLYGALKIVNMTWTQVAQVQNHEKVYGLASEMLDRVGQFMKHFDAVGDALDKAKDSYDRGRNKLMPKGQSILNTADKLLKLGAKDSVKNAVKPILDSEQ